MYVLLRELLVWLVEVLIVVSQLNFNRVQNKNELKLVAHCMCCSYYPSTHLASKHAVEGMMKCLRQELHPWNIFVANINPGFMK